MSGPLQQGLAEIVGDKHVLTGEALAGLDPGFIPDNFKADLAVSPVSVREVAAIVALCAAHRTPIVPHGGRTGLAGGAASKPGSVVIDLHRMNGIERLDPLAGIVLVQAGSILQSVEEAANVHGLSVGVDLGARGSATIGGMIATNAGGMEAFRNGPMRSRLLGIEAVLPNGAVLDDLTQVTKCNEGYDLKHLFCGSEGTLGIVTRAVLRLLPRLEANSTMLIAVEDAASALGIMRAARGISDVMLVHAEIMWRRYAKDVANGIGLSAMLRFADAPAYLLLDVIADEDSLLAFLSDAGVEDAIIAKNEGERRDIWRIREESFLIDSTVPHCQWFDISVPLDRIDEIVAGIESRLCALDPEIGIWVMGHLGDGNLHYTIGNGHPADEARRSAIAEAVYVNLKRIGGAFSAEHGIGAEKRGSLSRYADPEKLRLMAEIKRAFDPLEIMNPGKVI